MAKYLTLEFKSGKFFEYSGEQKEGYDKYESGSGNVSYRKYYDEITGELMSASLYDGKFGQQISLVIKDETGDFCYTPVNLYDQKGQVDNTYAESLIKHLPLLEVGQQISIRGYNFKPEDSKYSRIGVSIKISGEKVKPTITNSYYKDGKLVKGDVPALEFKLKAGKNKPTAISIEKKDDYLIDVMENNLARLGRKDVSEDKPKNSIPTATPEQAFEPVNNTSFLDVEDDLPF